MPPAARVGDMHVCPMVTVLVPHVGGPILPPCQVNVLIGGMPAARVSDMAVCVGPPDVIVKGSFTVLIGGMPAARMFDITAHGGVIITGMPNVIIGEAGSGSSYMGVAMPGLAEGEALLATAQSFSDPKKQAEALKQAAEAGTPLVQLC
jgi:uncharacterized Zn-binding protein involved in type VI secretion